MGAGGVAQYVKDEFGYTMAELSELTGVEYGTLWVQMKNGYCAFPRRQSRGHSNHPLYGTWDQMHRRCGNPKRSNYKNYGGRGISVCDRWDSFEQFVADMGPRPSSKHTLDRIDGNGNYEPGNVRWATWEVQNSNRRKRVRKGIERHGDQYRFSFDRKRYTFPSYQEAVESKAEMYANNVKEGVSSDI